MAVYWGRNLHLIGQMDRIRMTSLRLDFTPCDLVCIRRIRFVCCMSIRMRLERAVSEGTAGAAIYRRNRALNALRIHFQPIFLHFLNTKKIKPECSSSSSSSDIDWIFIYIFFCISWCSSAASSSISSSLWLLKPQGIDCSRLLIKRRLKYSIPNI